MNLYKYHTNPETLLYYNSIPDQIHNILSDIQHWVSVIIDNDWDGEYNDSRQHNLENNIEEMWRKYPNHILLIMAIQEYLNILYNIDDLTISYHNLAFDMDYMKFMDNWDRDEIDRGIKSRGEEPPEWDIARYIYLDMNYFINI